MKALRLAHFLGLPRMFRDKPQAPSVASRPAGAAAAAPDLAALLAAERRKERNRCAAIIGSASGLRFTPMALQLATSTDLPAAEAIAILDSCAKDQAQAMPSSRPSLSRRMAALGEEANPAPGPSPVELPAEHAPAASILASASKARGEASPIPTTPRT